MKYFIIFLTLLASLAAAAPFATKLPRQDKDKPSYGDIGASNSSGILQFQIDYDTYTSNTRIHIPGKLSFRNSSRPLSVLAAGVVSTQGIANPRFISCQVWNARGEEIGQFGYGNPTMMANGNRIIVDDISCILLNARCN